MQYFTVQIWTDGILNSVHSYCSCFGMKVQRTACSIRQFRFRNTTRKKKKLLCWRKNIYSLSQFFHSKWVTRFAYQQRMFQVQAKLWADSGRIRYWQSCIYEKLWLTCTCYKNGSPQMAISNSATSFNWHIARPTWYFCAICVR